MKGPVVDLGLRKRQHYSNPLGMVSFASKNRSKNMKILFLKQYQIIFLYFVAGKSKNQFRNWIKCTMH